MECNECSVDGERLVHMEPKLDEDGITKLSVCPECGREEIVGFGK